MGSLNKPHVVFVPYPAQGHINPLMQLAKILHLRGFYITFVNTKFNHRRLIRSQGLDFVNGLQDFRFQAIPDGLPFSDVDATQDLWALSESIQKNCLDPFREVLTKLNSSCMENPPVTCIISDGLMTFTIKAAQELGIREVQFYTTSACGLMAYLSFGELIRRGLVPFKGENFVTDGTLDTPIDLIPGMENILLKDFPTPIRTTDPNDILLNFMKDETENCLKSSAIIINTFDDLEHEVLQELATKFPRIYTLGPLPLLLKRDRRKSQFSGKSSLWKEDFKCLEWLDQRQNNSVMFVSFGSITVMSDKHFNEFAWGLANSKHPFLWVVRPDLVPGNSELLSKEYYKEIKDRGLVVSWCPQEKVLSHPSTAAFLTHGGWNSIIESVCGGVPVICWPFFDEQPTNSHYSCNVWGIGLEINQDVKRDEVEALVREMMEGEKGKRLKKMALEWKKKAEEATLIGGSSYNNLYSFINDILYGRSK